MNKSTFSLNDTPWVDFYQLQNPRPEENYTFPAIIICPGGGYQHISNREADPLTLAFLAQGYQVFILNYTVMNKGTDYNFLSQNITEVQAVFALINQHHEQWQINPEHVFLLGCSAGGHLAAWYGNSEQIYRPKGVILCYPVTSFTFGWPSDLSHFNFEIENISEYNISEKVTSATPLLSSGIPLMMQVFLSITVLNIVTACPNTKSHLKLIFLKQDHMAFPWRIGQQPLLMIIVLNQFIVGSLGPQIG